MGAGCSTGSAAKVQDSIKPSNITQLTQEAQEQLKQLQAQNPDGTIDAEALKRRMMAGKEEDDVVDKDIRSDEIQTLKHQVLWLAVETNDAEKVTSYLDTYEETSGEELKEAELYDHTGNSVIHKAASLGHAEVLMLLLERTGATPDLVNSSLATPLHLACKNARVDAAKFLIGCGVDANVQDEHGQVPLLICCIHGHFELARLMLEASASGHLPEPLEVDLKDHRGLSPLNCAAIKGDFDMAKLLVLNGGAAVDGASPKGCTPLLYAARGGYAEVVRFLLARGASALRQDNAGGTVLHHAIEKGHVDVLAVLQEHGIDVHSAIEIADNAGRTPVFEAIDNHETPDILRLLTKPRKDGGFEANVNIMSYNGQTPLFSAVREGHMAVVKAMVEECGAKVDLTQGELFKEELDEQPETYSSLEEKFFMDAYKNCMTPLHVAVVLGYDEILHYLIEHGANPNLQTKLKGYSSLHLAVLANKPEIIIELLTRSQANPYLPDFGGRTLQDMVEIFIPSYLESFKALLENLQSLKQGGLEESSGVGQEESLAALAKRGNEARAPVVATHYYNPDDDRTIHQLGGGEDTAKALLKKAEEEQAAEVKEGEGSGDDKKSFHQKFTEMDEKDIEIDADQKVDQKIELVYGRKIALSFLAQDWKYKELALKIVYKQTDKYLDAQARHDDDSHSLEDVLKASAAAVSHTSREKVIKVFSVSLQLLNLMISSQKVEKSGQTDVLRNAIVEKNIVLKLLQKSEEGNTRVTNKIHESLLDLSFNPEIGEALTSSFILQRIQAHNRANAQKLAAKKLAEEGRAEGLGEKIETEASLGSYKGLLAQLALLYKFINSFGIASRTRGPLSVKDVLKAVVPAVQHPNQDVRNASSKILLDVQKLSGCVTEEELTDLEDKHKSAILAKLKNVEVEKNLRTTESRARQGRTDLEKVDPIREQDNEGDETDRAEVPETISMSSPSKADTVKARLTELKNIIAEKGAAKEWQEREIALKAVDDVFGSKRFDKKDVLEDVFLQDCLVLIKAGLIENNMAIYLLTLEVAGVFFAQALASEVVLGSLPGLLLPVVLRTTDTTTRVRKKSVDLVYQVWDHKEQIPGDKLKLGQLRDSQNGELGGKTDSMCQIIAQVICDPQNGEKAIIGRLGLFIKRASLVDGAKDLATKPLQMVLGKNYEQLTEFACQWISHKNTKVRQNALRLIVEVCRINCLDPRGSPFKQRVVNFILALRSSQRDPLVLKINEVCLKETVKNTSPSRAGHLEQFINVDELELTMAVGAKGRAVSMDHAGAKRRLQSGRPGSKAGKKDGGDSGTNPGSTAMLPSIGGPGGGAPRGQAYPQPVIVLPHSEPLTEEQQQSYFQLVEFFGIQIITAFMAKSWATRLAAIEKVGEQLHNLDPSRRDAMSAEINRQNLPAEVSMGIFLELMFEGLKDPVLKNYIAILDLFQRALPTFFRYIQPMTLRAEMMHIIREIIRKCTDMKQKIREASINFCLYLSHQSPVGPEYMVEQVLQELDFVQNEKNLPKNKETAVAQNFGNSQLISSCLGLLSEYQTQTKILQPSPDSEALLKRFLDQINSAFRHSNPQVRKEAEKLFKNLYCDFGQQLEEMLVDQKPALVQKLLSSAKQEVVAKNALNSGPQTNPSQVIRDAQKPQTEAQKLQLNVTRAQEQIRGASMETAELVKVLEGSDQFLADLKLPNPKRRQKAIVEIKKAISRKIVGKLTQDQARELFEPLTVLMRQLLQDDNTDIYLESLGLLKFIVGNLAPYLSTLDLHLMMGSFIGIIVQNTTSSANMRIQVSSDKVIVFFAKHQNIGPFVVAKEINKNLERINKTVMQNVLKMQEVLAEKKAVLLRFYGILQLLLQQFSIVLCYQPEFYIKCLECIADSMIASSGKGPQQEGEEVVVKQICAQIIQNLYAIDYKLLDTTVSKLDDLDRKTPLRKAIIEYESQQKQGKNYIDVGKLENQNLVVQPHKNVNEDQMRDTQMSFASSTQRQSLFSPGSTHTMARGQSPGGFGSSQYDGNWTKISQNQGHNSETPGNVRGTRRMMSHGSRQAAQGAPTEDYLANHPVSNLTQSSWKRRQELPALDGVDSTSQNLNKTGQLLPQINTSGRGLMGSGLQGGALSYKFEAGGFSEENKDLTKAESQKFKVGSNRGAGFSSSTTNTGPHYEPTGGSQRRTPRRTLGVLQNENNGVKATDVMGPSSGLRGKPSGMNSNISWPSQAGRTLDQGNTLGNVQQQAKPPLYVPGASRQPLRSSQDKNQGSYTSKTGFSSMGQSKPSVLESTGFSSEYTPSALTATRQNQLGSDRPRSGRKRGDSLTKPPQPKSNAPLPGAANVQYGANSKY